MRWRRSEGVVQLTDGPSATKSHLSSSVVFFKISYTKQSREEGNTFFQNCYPKIISMLPGLMNLLTRLFVSI